MAISTYKTYLMKKGQSEDWAKVIDIKDYPDLGGSPELIETTTLSNKMSTFIPGIQKTEALEFTGNYTKSEYTTLVALGAKEETYAVWFGATGDGPTATPTGSDGKFEFKGTLSVYVLGGGVNDVVQLKVTIVPSTEITAA